MCDKIVITTMKDTLLQLKDIHVHYGGVKALQGVSLGIHEGEFVALLGPNGAGKSTVLKAIFGMAPIETGHVMYHGASLQPVAHEMVTRGVAFVPQGRRVFKHLTILENLEIGGYAIRDKKVVRERIEEVLKFFPLLLKKKHEKSGTLSGGGQQMLAIARGLMLEPRLLLLDEPSLGLAPKVVKEVFEKIKEINEHHKTAIIVVEHNAHSLLGIVDRAYVLKNGEVFAEGKPKDLLEKGVLEKAFLS